MQNVICQTQKNKTKGRVKKKIVEFFTKGAETDFPLRKKRKRKKHSLKTLDFAHRTF